jgi:hypothetical protein
MEDVERSQNPPDARGHHLRGSHQDLGEALQGRTNGGGAAHRRDDPAPHCSRPGGVTSESRARGDDLAPGRARRSPCSLPASGGPTSHGDHEGRHHDEREDDQRQRSHGRSTPGAAAEVPALGRPKQRADDPANGTGLQGGHLPTDPTVMKRRPTRPTERRSPPSFQPGLGSGPDRPTRLSGRSVRAAADGDGAGRAESINGCARRH